MRKYAVSLIYTGNKGKYIHNELWVVEAISEEKASEKAQKLAGKTANSYCFQFATIIEIV